jgi:hypothetical protein
MSDNTQTRDNPSANDSELLRPSCSKVDRITPQDCPNCPNMGWYFVFEPPNSRIPQSAYPVECEFCHSVPNSKFNLSANAKGRDGEAIP